jgi:hypothetical protein
MHSCYCIFLFRLMCALIFYFVNRCRSKLRLDLNSNSLRILNRVWKLKWNPNFYIGSGWNPSSPQNQPSWPSVRAFATRVLNQLARQPDDTAPASLLPVRSGASTLDLACACVPSRSSPWNRMVSNSPPTESVRTPKPKILSSINFLRI